MQIRNVSGEKRDIPSLGLTVEEDEVFDVADDQVDGLLAQPLLWEADGPDLRPDPPQELADPDHGDDDAPTTEQD